MSRVSTLSSWASKLNRRKTPWVVDEGLLRSLVPLNLLGADELKQLVERSRVIKLAGGKELQRDPAAGGTGYLLSGIVERLSAIEAAAAVAAGTDAARHPLWDAKSGAVTVRAKTEVTVLEVDVATDELVLSGAASAADYEVSDIRSATATDWLTRFLQAKVFTRLPLNNIRELLARMEEIDVGAGQQIMRQGESDAYYYIVKRGSCRVTTQPAAGAGELELARLGEGDGFGEDALITDGRRSATVTMLVDGSLMRLGKQDFTMLLVEPVLQYADAGQARDMLAKGALLLDVRKAEEYARDGLPQALNIPLSLLRSRLQELDAGATYVTVSNVLNRSTAAAFFLCQHGIDAHILKDGAKALSRMAAAPADRAPAKAQPAAVRPTPALTLVEGGAEPAAAAAPRATPAAQAPADSGELRALRAELAQEQERARRLAEQVAAAADLEAHAERLAAEVESRTAEAAAVTARLQEERDQRRGLEQRLNEGQQARQQLQEEYEHGLAALEELQAERARGLAELEELRRERTRDLAVRDDLETARSALNEESERRRTAERCLQEQEREVARLQQALAGGESIKAELASLQQDLQEQRDRAHAAAEHGRAVEDDLQRLRSLEREYAVRRADWDAAGRKLADETARADAATHEAAAQREELQRLRAADAVTESIKAECDALERRLHVEMQRREEAAARLVLAEAELERAGERNEAARELEMENTRLAEVLQREREDRRTFERELALQTVELQRLRRAREEEDGSRDQRIAALQAEIEAERGGRAEAQAREAAQAEQLQRVIQQANRLRQRLKKVCTLARDMEGRRRAAERHGDDAAAEVKALKDQVYERSLRMAELELVRRKLEQELAAARSSSPVPAAESPSAVRPEVLRLPAPEDRAAPASRLPRLSAVGRRAVQAAVLIVVTLLCVYGLLAAGILKAHAGDWENRIMHLTGLVDAN